MKPFPLQPADLASHGIRTEQLERLGALIGKHIALDDAPAALMAMDRFDGLGISVITQF